MPLRIKDLPTGRLPSGLVKSVIFISEETTSTAYDLNGTTESKITSITAKLARRDKVLFIFIASINFFS